jgi:uncharacterized repeat protein (TIGR03803 family)
MKIRRKRLSSLQANGVLILAATILVSISAWAGTERVLYNFKGGADGWGPDAGLVVDPAGNLYGTTFRGGGGCTRDGCGTVFELTKSGGKWREKVLLRFNGLPGILPTAALILDAAGNLYGTASDALGGNGMVFKLTPDANGKWSVSVLHAFAGGLDGEVPFGSLVSDAAGNLYGTTSYGGGYGSCTGVYNQSYCGTVFELSPPRTKGGKWKEKVLYHFKGGSDGGNPSASLILDAAGNLYSTTAIGGAYGWGTVFKLTHGSNGKWMESVLHSFDERTDGAEPFSALIFDKIGNLYGTTYSGASSRFGTVFKLAPSSDGWKETVLHTFNGGSDGGNPLGSLILDSAGNIYGATSGEVSNSSGTVFKLTPGLGSAWTETILYSFTGGGDGAFPNAPLIMDSRGNLYGAGGGGGALGIGVVFEVLQ